MRSPRGRWDLRRVDVAAEESVEALYARRGHDHGGIDVLFNNAGISPPEDDSILTTSRRVASGSRR